MQSQYNMRSPAVKRLMKEAQELKDPTELFYAQPLEDNLFEWHFTIRGPIDTDFDGGIFHGRIVLPPDYPMKPPSIIILTPNGRFEVNKKICLSISGHHPESWQPSWSIRTALLAIIGFMPTHGAGAIGSLDYTTDERKVLSKKSQCWKCPICGCVNDVLKSLTDASKKTSEEAKDLALKINFQAEKGIKPGSDKVPTTTTPSSNAGITVTGGSTVTGAEGGDAAAAAAVSGGATAAAATPTWMLPPHMNYPSPLNMGNMPGMFPQSFPFFPSMTGQFPYHFRFPYPPTSMDPNVNSMPNCRMMPPFPNPFLPPMFPGSYAFPQPVADNSNASVANVSPFSFPFMPNFPTVPGAAMPTTTAGVTMSAPLSNSTTLTSSSGSSTAATQSKQLTAPSSSSSASSATTTNPSTTTTTTTTATTTPATTSKPLFNGTGGISQNSTNSASTHGLSVPPQPPSSQTVTDSLSDTTPPKVETLTAGGNDVNTESPPSPSSSSPSPPSSSASLASSTTQAVGSPGTTLRHRITSSTATTTTAAATTGTTTATAAAAAATTSTPPPPQVETAGVASPPNATTIQTGSAAVASSSSRGAASFVLMLLLGVMILLLCLRRLYVSVDHLPYSDYMQ